MVGFVIGGGLTVRPDRLSATRVSRSQRLVSVKVAPVRMSLIKQVSDRAKRDWEIVKRWAKPEKLATTAMTALVVMALLLAPVNSAMAASGGGRVGGSNFRSAPSRSYSAPSRSYSPPSRIYVAPSTGYGYGYNPFMGPMGIPGAGTGVYVSPVVGYGGFNRFLFWFVVDALAIGLAYRTFTNSSWSSGGGGFSAVSRGKSTITKLKIALLSNARGLQVDLDKLARNSDTTSRRGLSMILSDTALSLLRHPEFWAYAALSSDETDDAEKSFGRLSIREQAKIEEFTLSNVKNRKMESRRASATRADMFQAPSEYISVTILVASEGRLELPRNIRSASDVRTALEILGGIDENSIEAVDILWTPQSMEDTLSKQQLLTDHPELRSL